jgi:hypothetical protein
LIKMVPVLGVEPRIVPYERTVIPFHYTEFGAP